MNDYEVLQLARRYREALENKEKAIILCKKTNRLSFPPSAYICWSPFRGGNPNLNVKAKNLVMYAHYAVLEIENEIEEAVNKLNESTGGWRKEECEYSDGIYYKPMIGNPIRITETIVDVPRDSVKHIKNRTIRIFEDKKC